MRGAAGFILAGCLALAGCATTAPDAAPARSPAPAGEGGTTATPATAPGEALGVALVQPFEDLNLSRKTIPPVLEAAFAAPYAPLAVVDCASVAAAVSDLDAALGPDLDAPKPAGRQDNLAGKAVGGALRSATGGLIPYRGLIRQLTGAERHSTRVRAAILSGVARRAYLKGVGERLGCAPPAAPLPPPPPDPAPTAG